MLNWLILKVLGLGSIKLLVQGDGAYEVGLRDLDPVDVLKGRVRLQVRHRLLGAADTIFRVELAQFIDQIFFVIVEIGVFRLDVFTRPFNLPFEDFLLQFDLTLTWEGGLADPHLEVDETESPDIDGNRVFLAFDDLWAQVVVRADECIGAVEMRILLRVEESLLLAFLVV